LGPKGKFALSKEKAMNVKEISRETGKTSGKERATGWGPSSRKKAREKKGGNFRPGREGGSKERPKKEPIVVNAGGKKKRDQPSAPFLAQREKKEKAVVFWSGGKIVPKMGEPALEFGKGRKEKSGGSR